MEPAKETRVPIVPVETKVDNSKHMRAVEWHGKRNIKLNTHRPVPVITHPSDAILQVTTTAICGSDLHLYNGAYEGLHPGFVVGHEFMGIVHDVGTEVSKFRKGDRVVACFDIACGQCHYCSDRGLFSACDLTNASKEQEQLYGDRTAGFFGVSELTGGWQGGQAEFVRVPIADVNLLKVPDNLSDQKVVLLSDILCTAWHSTELGGVGEGDTVGIWGCGPVGLLAAHCAHVRGAKEVFVVDEVQYRLDHAKSRLPFVTPINFKKQNVRDVIRARVPFGVDVGIDAVGLHYTHSLLHKAEMALGLEQGTPEALNDIIYNVRKGGTVGLIGVYPGFTNHFNLGALMEKGSGYCSFRSYSSTKVLV